jgi:hypothetical protein
MSFTSSLSKSELTLQRTRCSKRALCNNFLTIVLKRLNSAEPECAGFCTLGVLPEDLFIQATVGMHVGTKYAEVRRALV